MVIKGLQMGAEGLKLTERTRMEEWDNCGLAPLVHENKQAEFL